MDFGAGEQPHSCHETYRRYETLVEELLSDFLEVQTPSGRHPTLETHRNALETAVFQVVLPAFSAVFVGLRRSIEGICTWWASAVLRTCGGCCQAARPRAL